MICIQQKPLRLNITLKVLEPVKVTVTGKNVATVTAEPVDCYRMLEMDLPENFIETGKPENHSDPGGGKM